jgi:RNA polymerase sigma-70 factor (ECF subfamily)
MRQVSVEQPGFDENAMAEPAAAAPDEDADALAGVAAGDLGAFNGLVNRHKHRLIQHIRRRISDPHQAEDVAQEAFLRLFRAARAARYSGQSRVITWLFAIAGNCVTDHLRNQSRRRAGGADVANESEPSDPSATAERNEADRRVEDLLARLPDPQREVIELHVLDGLTFREIAELAGCPVPTVKSRLVYALRKLKQLLDARRS